MFKKKTDQPQTLPKMNRTTLEVGCSFIVYSLIVHFRTILSYFSVYHTARTCIKLVALATTVDVKSFTVYNNWATVEYLVEFKY